MRVRGELSAAAMEEGAPFRVVEIPIADVKPVIEAWDQLSEDDRAALRDLLLRLRHSILKTGTATAETAQEIWGGIIEPAIAEIPPAAAELLTLMKKHTWDDRT